MSRPNALQLSAAAGPVLSPSQKRFNTLIRQIERARQTLTAWQDNSDVAATKRWLKRQRQRQREAEFDFAL